MASFTGRSSGGVTSVAAADASITVAGTTSVTVAVNQAFAFAWTVAQSWTVDDATRTATTDILTLTHTTTDPLFGGVGMGASILLKLEDDSGASENAGRIGIVWVDPAVASKDSAFVVSLRRANGALAEQFRVSSTLVSYSRDGVTSSAIGTAVDISGSLNNVLSESLENQSSGGSAAAIRSITNDAGARSNTLVYSSGVGGTLFDVAAAHLSAFYGSGGAAVAIGTLGAQAVTLGTNATGRWQVAGASGDIVPILTDTYDIGTSALRVMDVWTGGRVHFAKGADVASANDMTLGGGGISFDITGAVQINTIASTSYQAGDIVILQFDGAPTVKNLTAGAGAQIELAGSADFIASAGDELGLKYNGTYWREIFRTVI